MSDVDKIKDLSNSLQSWNPMQEDYTDSHFNQYSSEPGTILSTNFRQSKQNIYSKNQTGANGMPRPFLVFKNVPKSLTRHALLNACQNYGNVLSLRDSNKNEHYYGEFANVADMEAVYRGLENNVYGFQVHIGKHYLHKQENSLPPPLLDKTAPNLPASFNIETGKYIVSRKLHPRPHIEDTPIVCIQNYEDKENLLHVNDPQRKFLIENDAHELERQNLWEPKINNAQVKTNHKYLTGRMYTSLPEQAIKYMENKRRQTGDAQHINKPPTFLNYDKCAECETLAKSCCSRCLTFYCCVECQLKAWPKHRYTCGKPTQLKLTPSKEKATNGESHVNDADSGSDKHFNTSIESSSTQKPINNIYEAKMPLSGNAVTITAISKSNVVFIRSKIHEDNVTFFQTISTIHAQSKNYKKLTSPPKAGEIVMARFAEVFNRVMVLNANDLDSIRVIFIDYGNIHQKTMSELYEAPEYFVQLPRLAKPVILKNVPSAYINENMSQFMYSYLEGIELIVKYDAEKDFLSDKGVYSVELLDAINHRNFNKTVAALCKPVEPHELYEVMYIQYLKQQPIMVADNLELIVMDNSLSCTGCISCTTKPFVFEIQKYQSELQHYAERLKTEFYTPRDDELCIARYSIDKKWYRGRCLERKGDGFPIILFIDYGNVVPVSIRDIRPYPAAFTLPIFTVDCEIEGLSQQDSEELTAKLEELIPNGSTIKCARIVKHEDNFYTITLPEVIEQLKAMNLLKENDKK